MAGATLNFDFAELDKFNKTLEKFLIITVVRPEICITRNHIFKRKNLTAFIFVSNSNPDSVFFRLPFFQNTITEFCMIGTAHLIYIEENYSVAKAVIIQIKDIADNTKFPSYNITEL